MIPPSSATFTAGPLQPVHVQEPAGEFINNTCFLEFLDYRVRYVPVTLTPNDVIDEAI